MQETAGLTLVPGRVPLEHWRKLYFGASASVDAASRAEVERGQQVVTAILATGEPVYGINTGFGKLASVRIADADLAKLQYNLVVSHFVGVGDALPAAVVRLILSLKIASLAQGASGVRWQVIERLQTCLDRDLLPIIPAQGSVGASGDLAPLAHMAAALIGVGPVRFKGQIMPAVAAWEALGRTPFELGAKEGLALLNGTQASTALALAGLFEAERGFAAALATGALATAAAGGSPAPFDRRIHALRRHLGQIDVADALRRILDGDGLDPSGRVQDPYCLRCQPQVMGACLDLMRQAAATLATEANAVSDNPLVLVEDAEVISGGNFHAEPVAFAADGIALAICEIGSIAERRIAMLLDATLSGLPAFLTANPGLNSGLMMPHVTAAALVSENKQQAFPASVDSIPTSANQEDHVSMSAHGARRLGSMAENLIRIVGVELLAAAQACDFHGPRLASPALERVRRLLRERVEHLDDDRPLAPDMAAAADLVRSGALAKAVEKELEPVTIEFPTA